MTERTARPSFDPPISAKTMPRSRHAGLELLATIALAVCLVIAATAVSIGMARAQVLPGAAGWHAAAKSLLRLRP